MLAVWAFINPNHLSEVIDWTRRVFPGSGGICGSSETRCSLSLPQLATLSTHFGAEAVRVVEQRAGDLVYVPFGWAHQVINLRPCAKFAFDTCLSTRLPDYLHGYAALHSGLMRHADAALDFCQLAAKLPLLLRSAFLDPPFSDPAMRGVAARDPWQFASAAMRQAVDTARHHVPAAFDVARVASIRACVAATAAAMTHNVYKAVPPAVQRALAALEEAVV